MTEQVRYRLDRRMVKQAEKICKELGMTPTQAVSMFFSQLIKLGGMPFRPSNFPALEEYGVTTAQAAKAERNARKELEDDERTGGLTAFNGRIL